MAKSSAKRYITIRGRHWTELLDLFVRLWGHGRLLYIDLPTKNIPVRAIMPTNEQIILTTRLLDGLEDNQLSGQVSF